MCHAHNDPSPVQRDASGSSRWRSGAATRAARRRRPPRRRGAGGGGRAAALAPLRRWPSPRCCRYLFRSLRRPIGSPLGVHHAGSRFLSRTHDALAGNTARALAVDLDGAKPTAGCTRGRPAPPGTRRHVGSLARRRRADERRRTSRSKRRPPHETQGGERRDDVELVGERRVERAAARVVERLQHRRRARRDGLVAEEPVGIELREAAVEVRREDERLDGAQHDRARGARGAARDQRQRQRRTEPSQTASSTQSSASK